MPSRILTALAVLALLTASLSAADVHGIYPICERILAVQIRDGHTDFYDISSQKMKDTIQYTTGLVDKPLADEKSGYRLGSKEDSRFSAGLTPVASGRKSKTHQVHSTMKWDLDQDSPHASLDEHWIYLEFPEPLKEGATYQLQLPKGLVTNGDTWAFTFAPAKLDSPTIHVGQGGFTPDAPKYAYLGHWMGSFNTPVHELGGLELGTTGHDGKSPTGSDYTGAPFHVVNTDTGEMAFSGKAVFRRDKTVQETAKSFSERGSYSLCDAWELDFSSLKTPGRYRVVVPRLGRSLAFEIREDAYRTAFRTAMKGFFHVRSGIVAEAPGGVTVPRAHHPDDGVAFFYDPNFQFWRNSSGGSSVSDKPKEGKPAFDFKSRPIDPAKGKIFGWYYDAGDWDSYQNQHLIAPLSLIALYLTYPENFQDGDVGNRYKWKDSDPEWIDEGKNGLPDILDEARWVFDRNREWRDTLIAHGYGTGGFPGYLGRDAGVETAPWQDKRPQAITAEDPELTFSMAAGLAALAKALDVAAQRSGSTSPHPESATLLKEARDALAWADAYTAKDPESDPKLAQRLQRARMTAMAALYLATSDPAYGAQFVQIYRDERGFGTDRFNSMWIVPTMGQHGEIFYALTPENTPGYEPSIKNAFIESKRSASQKEMVQTMQAAGYRQPITRGRMHQGAITTPQPMVAIVRSFLPQDAELDNVLHAQAAYFLGGNELNMSHMTGIGQEREGAAFLPIEWAVYNSDSMAYRYRTFPGVTLYNRAGWDVGGHSNENANYKSFYPPTAKVFDAGWPFAERRTHHRWSIAGSEFTFWELLPCNAWVYGALAKPGGKPVTGDEPPTVSLKLPSETIPASGQSMKLSSTGSPDLDHVEYFHDWRFIGRSEDKPSGFAIDYEPARFGVKPGDSAKIIAIGYDRSGEFSLETPDVEKAVSFTAP